MTVDSEELLAAAVEAAGAAGRFLRSRFRQPAAHRPKGYAHDVVTDADVEAERIIRAHLRDATPQATIVGEEGGADGAGDICWFVDPLDGTYNFVRGVPLFAVSIGARCGGQVAAGCVYDPMNDEMFTAFGGDLTLNGAPVARPVPCSEPLVLCDIPTAGVEPAPGEYALLRDLLSASADVRRIGSSALALAYVAAGRAEVAANADVFAWDTVAGEALVRAAGGGYLDVPDPPPVGRCGGFVAWAPGWDHLGSRTADGLRAATRRPGGEPAALSAAGVGR